jgi:surface antigen
MNSTPKTGRFGGRLLRPLLPQAPQRASAIIGYALAAAIAALSIGFGGGLLLQATVDRAVRIAALDAADSAGLRQAVALTLETSPDGRTVTVNGAKTQHRITPLATFVTGDGILCREYRLATARDEIAVACRDQTGAWHPRAP